MTNSIGFCSFVLVDGIESKCNGRNVIEIVWQCERTLGFRVCVRAYAYSRWRRRICVHCDDALGELVCVCVCMWKEWHRDFHWHHSSREIHWKHIARCLRYEQIEKKYFFRLHFAQFRIFCNNSPERVMNNSIFIYLLKLCLALWWWNKWYNFFLFSHASARYSAIARACENPFINRQTS